MSERVPWRDAEDMMPAISRPIRQTQIQQIAKLRDPVLRNLLITLAYHDLARGMGDVVGEQNVTWCGFATWASRTAGREIRGEEIPGFLQQLIADSNRVQSCVERVCKRAKFFGGIVRSALGRHLLKLAGRISDHVSQQIALGNQLVFEELAPRYCDLITGGDVASEPAADSPTNAVDEAFASYRSAASEGDFERKAELVLLANLLAVRHEQERLQSYIKNALEAPVTDTLVSLRRAPILGTVFRTLRWLFPTETAELVDEIEEVWREVVTETVMTMKVPGQTLRLGDDVPPPPEGPFLPPALETLELPELVALVRELDRSQGNGRGTGADDWTVLAERMNYITTLFRSRQQESELRDAPFTPSQQTAMEQGRIPAGPL